MRARSASPWSVATAIAYLVMAVTTTAIMINKNQAPNGIVWFPAIIGGWFLIGGAACWFAIVLGTRAYIWNRAEITRSRRRPINHAYGRSARPDPNRPPVRPMTPDPIPSRETLEKDFAAGVADAVRAVHGGDDPIPTAPPVAVRVMNERHGGTTGLYAPNPANDPRPQDIRPDRVHPADVNPALTVTQADV